MEHVKPLRNTRVTEPQRQDRSPHAAPQYPLLGVTLDWHSG